MATMYYKPYRPYTTELRIEDNTPFEDGKFPPYEAMENVLPEYQYIFHDGKPDKQGKKTSPRANPGPSKRYEADDLEKNSMMLLDHQTQELTNYRRATHKMGQDVITLQQQVADLQNVNSRLRQDLAGYNDSKRIMLESQELEDLTRPDMVARYVTLKQTLSNQTDELKNYKAKLQAVQNELIKKNDQEKDFLKVQQAHSAQQKEIHRLQERLKKMKKLEETCKQQEDMIQKMESVIARHHRDRHKLGDKNKGAHDANEALLQENKMLRTQIDDLRAQLRLGGGNQNNSDDLEKMELLQALEKANGRIAALEKQLADNSRDWGKERSDYTLRLNEAEHGLGRTQGVMFHDFETYRDSQSPSSRSRSQGEAVADV